MPERAILVSDRVFIQRLAADRARDQLGLTLFAFFLTHLLCQRPEAAVVAHGRHQIFSVVSPAQQPRLVVAMVSCEPS